MADPDPKDGQPAAAGGTSPEVPSPVPPSAPATTTAAPKPAAPASTAAPKAAPGGPAKPKAPAPPEKIDYGFLPMSEEMDSAKWKLPPLTIVLIGIGAMVLFGLMFGMIFRYQPVASGQMRDAFCVELQDQASVLCTVQVTVRNESEKPIFIQSMKVNLLSADGKNYEDIPASAIDYDRYFQAFPALREHANEALKPETKIVTGQQVFGTVVVGFPVPKAQFDSRKNLLVTVQPYDRQPIVIVEKAQK